MNEAVLLWITRQDDRANPALRPFLVATEKEVHVHILDDDDLPDYLDAEAGDRVIGAVVAPSVQNPVANARLFLRRLPGREVIFIAAADQTSEPKRDINLAFLYGHHRTIKAADAYEGVRTIHRLLGQARRQRRSRWALARMNEQIAQARNETVHQKRLAISDRLLASILAQSPDALFALDLDGFVLAVNRAAVTNFGLKEAESSHFDNTGLKARLPELKELVADATRAKETRRQEILLRRPATTDAENAILEASASPVFDADNSLIGITVLLRDVTQLKMAERRLQELNEALEYRVNERTRELKEVNQRMEGFLYSVAHDLRAPIRAVAGFTQILEAEYRSHLSEEAQNLLERVTNAAMRMETLVQDLLAYSRVAKIELPLQPVDLAAVLESARSAVAEQIEESGAELHIQPSHGFVLAHQTTLEQALINLLGNALQYPRPDQPLRVKVFSERKDGRYRLSVEDNGIGVDSDYHEKIFRMFERVAINSNPSGTGIGLAIVKGGVERMGGTVGVESTPGEGSLFWIELPEATAPQT